jgi:four helix bundle protein
MAYQSFEELDVWKRACALAVDVYQALRETRDFGLRDQMQRAAVSIASNIAEGSERTTKEFVRYLSIARGSAAELRTQAYIAAKVGGIDKQTMKHLVSETKQLSKMLYALAKSLNA